MNRGIGEYMRRVNLVRSGVHTAMYGQVWPTDRKYPQFCPKECPYEDDDH